VCTEGESELVDKLSKVEYVALGAGWILCFWLLISVSNTHNLFMFSSSSDGHVKFSCRKNHLGATSLIRRDPSLNSRVVSVVSFRSLTTENGELGIFKTALQRTVLLKGLKVDVPRYSQTHLQVHPSEDNLEAVLKPVTVTSNDDSIVVERTNSHSCKETVSIFGQNSTQDCLGELVEKLRSIIKSKRDYNFRLNVDFSNISKVLIAGFQFNHFVDEALKLSIQSKIAETSHEESGLILRGHVLVKTNSGRVLECNRIVWDVKEEIFKVNGVYALNQNGTIETGRDVCLDMNLNEIDSSQSTPDHRKEQQKCFAKSLY